MKKRIISLALAIILSLGCLSGIPVSAINTHTHYINPYYDYYIFPHADVIDATVVQGNSRMLSFETTTLSGGYNDYYCATIYRGSLDQVIDDLDRGKEPEIMDLFYVNADEHDRTHEPIRFNWTADSRYKVGDYTLVCYLMNAETGDIFDDWDIFWTELHVVSERRPVTDFSIWAMRNDGWREIHEDEILEISSYDNPLYFCALPEPYPSTSRLDCSVYTAPETVIHGRSVNLGYISVAPSSDGIGRVRIVCGA